MLRTTGIDSVKNGKEIAMPVQSLPQNPSLENLRKQAKSLRKAVLDNEQASLVRVREFQPHPDEAISKFSRADSQLVLARSYGFSSWSKLKQYLEVRDNYFFLPPAPAAESESEPVADRFARLACLSYQSTDHKRRREQAREIFAAYPSVVRENIYVAATVGVVEIVRELLRANPGLVAQRGGRHAVSPGLGTRAEGATTRGRSTRKPARTR